MTQPDREQAISRAFVALADTLVDDYDIIDMLDQLVSHSVALLAADAAAIMLGDAHRHLRVVAASSDDARLMELLQLQNEQGPCWDCYHTATPVRVPDVAIADQWPMFAAAVAQAGSFRSVHALPLRLRGKSIGALNLFHHSPGPLPESDLTLGQALADVATIGILQQQAVRRSEVVTEQLQTALNSRVVIEQAKGVLAHHYGLTMEAAFDRLRRYTRNRHLHLAEVAQQIAGRRLHPATITTTSPTGVARR